MKSLCGSNILQRGSRVRAFYPPGGTPRLSGRQDARRYAKAPDKRADENFVLRPLRQSNIMTALAMEQKFQLDQTGQTLEHARLRQEALCQPSHPILATS